jgi:hypothetical protein
MDVQKLSEQLAGLRFETGYTFVNGTRYYETLSRESAEGLLRALQSSGYILCRQGIALEREHDQAH